MNDSFTSLGFISSTGNNRKEMKKFFNVDHDGLKGLNIDTEKN